MTNQPDQILWLDIETTGLQAEGGRILELGMICTDLASKEIARAAWVIYCPPEHLKYLSPKVREMHRRSLLLDALASASEHKDSAPAVLYHAMSFISKHCTSPPILAGYRVAFDRRWLKVWYPLLDANLSEYTLDISAMRQVRSASGIAPAPRAEVIHRTLGDCQCALDEWRAMIISQR